MNAHRVDIQSTLLAIAGIATSGLVEPLGKAIDGVYPGKGDTIAHAISTTSLGAAIILRIVYNRTPDTNVASSPSAPQPNPMPAPTASTPPEEIVPHG